MIFQLNLRPATTKNCLTPGHSGLTNAEVAELVDAHDSKSCILGCVGSIPTFGTKLKAVSNGSLFYLLSIESNTVFFVIKVDNKAEINPDYCFIINFEVTPSELCHVTI